MTRPPLPEPPAAYQYLFNSYYGQVWRNDSASWNGSNPVASRTLHTADQMHAYADTCTAELRERIKVLEDALRPVEMLRSLGGMMPGSREVMMLVVDAARAAMEPSPTTNQGKP